MLGVLEEHRPELHELEDLSVFTWAFLPEEDGPSVGGEHHRRDTCLHWSGNDQTKTACPDVEYALNGVVPPVAVLHDLPPGLRTGLGKDPARFDASLNCRGQVRPGEKKSPSVE